MNRFMSFVRQATVGNRPELAQAAGNIGWHVADKAVRMFVALAVGVWMARYLGPEQFGLLNYALAIVAFFGVAAGLGQGGLLVRDLVQEPARAPTILGTGFALQVGGGLAFFGVAAGAFLLFHSHPPTLQIAGIVLAAGLLVKAAAVVKCWFEAEVQSRYTVWVESGAFLLGAGLSVALLLLEAPLLAFAGVILAEGVLAGAGLLWIYSRRSGMLRRWKFDASYARRLLTDGWPLLLSGLAITIYMRIDQVMLGRMQGHEAVGVYSAAVRIGEAWLFLPTAIVATLFPWIARSRALAPSLYRARLQAVFNGLVLLAYLAAIAMTIAAVPIMSLLFGDPYADGAAVLAALAWCGVFASLSAASGSWYLLEGLQRMALSRNLFGMVMNIALNFVLIPRHGALGAALATLVSQFCAAFLFDAFDPRTRAIFRMKLEALLLLDILRSLLTAPDQREGRREK